MVITGVVAGLIFALLGYWLGMHRGHFIWAAICFVVVGVTIGGTPLGSSVQRGAFAALNGIYNVGVSLVHS